MGGLPNDKDAKKVIRSLEANHGWVYDTDVGSSAHRCGDLQCGFGCKIKVFSTGNNTARALWSAARRCSHGRAPDTRTP